MENFIWVMLWLMCICCAAIVTWFIIKSHESDEAYNKAIDEIYGRKKKR